MNAREIVKRVDDLIVGWKKVGVETLKAPQYKRDFFRLCLEVHGSDFHRSGSPLLTADGLYDAITARWGTGQDPRCSHGLDEVREMWQEWLYALDRGPHEFS